jgi:uncharacterized protein (DUF58 family)
MSAFARLLAALILLAGALLHRGGLVLLALLILAVDGLVVLWRHWCLRGIVYERSFSSTRAFFGETIDLRIRVENRKVLPVPWLLALDEVPQAVTFQSGRVSPSDRVRRAVLTHSFSLRPYERVTRHYPIRCDRRGRHGFGPVQLRSGDPFGLTAIEVSRPADDFLLIYPKIVPLTALGLPDKEPFGEHAAARRLIADPAMTIGAREYAPGDSLRRIHWTATARTGSLHSRIYDYTATRTLAVFLDINTFERIYEGINPTLLELAITTAASVVTWAIAQRYHVGLYSNGQLFTGERQIAFPPSQHPSQGRRVLEALASVIPVSLLRIEDILRGQAPRLPWGATIVVITGRVTDALLATLLQLQAAGHVVTLIAYGHGVPPRIGQYLTVYDVGGEEVWDGLDALDFAG